MHKLYSVFYLSSNQTRLTEINLTIFHMLRFMRVLVCVFVCAQVSIQKIKSRKVYGLGHWYRFILFSPTCHVTGKSRSSVENTRAIPI